MASGLVGLVAERFDEDAGCRADACAKASLGDRDRMKMTEKARRAGSCLVTCEGLVKHRKQWR